MNVSKQDADKNAIITLHCLSKMVSMEVEQGLGTLKHLFTLKTKARQKKNPFKISAPLLKAQMGLRNYFFLVILF